MFTHHNPAIVSTPASAYSHGVGVPAGARWLYISGQIGLTPDGDLAGDAEAQMDACWKRIFAILTDAGMTKENLVKITAYVTDPNLVGTYREIRDRHLKGTLTASTLLVISALAHPDWVVEIEAVAAEKKPTPMR
jgi:enamine deaminase RidA (YjgF/YER057c/UK114 family)